MARGWESKSVEAQIESAQSRSRKGALAAVELTPAQVSALREKENLALSRKRVLHELETSKNPRYVRMLQTELRALEEKIRKLG